MILLLLLLLFVVGVVVVVVVAAVVAAAAAAVVVVVVFGCCARTQKQEIAQGLKFRLEFGMQFPSLQRPVRQESTFRRGGCSGNQVQSLAIFILMFPLRVPLPERPVRQDIRQVHPVSVRRFPSFRTQPLENLSHYL